MSDNYDVPSLNGMSRAEVIGIRARLMADPNFTKAVMDNEAEARLALQSISEHLVANGGGGLSAEEMKVTGY